MWMQQGRNWHFGEIEFFGGYETYRSKASFWYMFHVYTLNNYMVIKLIRCRYDYSCKSSMLLTCKQESRICADTTFYAFHGNIRNADTPRETDWISSLLVYSKNFNNICIVYEYQTFSDCKVYFFFKTYKHTKIRVDKLILSTKTLLLENALNSEAIFFYYFDEIDQETNLRQVSSLEILINKGVINAN